MHSDSRFSAEHSLGWWVGLGVVPRSAVPLHICSHGWPELASFVVSALLFHHCLGWRSTVQPAARSCLRHVSLHASQAQVHSTLRAVEVFGLAVFLFKVGTVFW